MNIRSILPILLSVAVLSCDAQNDTITSSLFDMSAASASTVSGSVNMRSGSIRIAGPVSFFDSGGPSGNYGNNLNQVLTVYPAQAGERVALWLQSFNVEFEDGCGYDVFEIFNGTSTSAPRLDFWCGSADSYWIPFYFVANNPSGALTFRFKSDGSNTFTGWTATLYTMTNIASYAVTLPRAVGQPGNSSWINYTAFGPSQLPTDQGFCISTTNSVPSRTNGATCYTASINKYGTNRFVLSGLGANQTHYMRAFITPPGGSTVYTTTVAYAPLLNELPDVFSAHFSHSSSQP